MHRSLGDDKEPGGAFGIGVEADGDAAQLRGEAFVDLAGPPVREEEPRAAVEFADPRRLRGTIEVVRQG